MLHKLGAGAQTGPYPTKAALAVVVAMEESRFAVSDASRAIESMVLVAWSEGVGSNFVGFGGLPAVNALLDIPKEIQVFAVLPFGYPKNPVGKGKKKRKPLGEVVHRARFGQPFEV